MELDCTFDIVGSAVPGGGEKLVPVHRALPVATAHQLHRLFGYSPYVHREVVKANRF